MSSILKDTKKIYSSLVPPVTPGDPKNAATLATTAALAANTRTGNILTATANGAIGSIDSVTVTAGMRILVKNEVTGANNGIYDVTTVGTISTPYVLTRSSDADEDSEVTSGMVIPVSQGTINGGSVYVLSTPDPITLNTTSLTFSVSGLFLTKTNNLSDVANAATALSNLAGAPLASPTFTGTVTTPAIIVSSETASTIASFDASKNIKSLATSTYPSLTELTYVKGVTSAIQTQLDTKTAKTITFNRQTASYTLVAGDAQKCVEMNVGTANNLTVNNSVFSAGDQVIIAQYGAGQTTFVAGSGVTIRSASGKLKLTGQYSLATLIFISASECYLSGDISA
jgi:hypothetical protein